jgi:two-component system, sensor histidine kinase and response regulator
VQRAAHAVKGSVGTFGARPARELAARLEGVGREGRLDEAPALLDALEAELTRVTVALRDHAAALTA